MSFEKVVPDWQAKGIEPPQSKREIGWEVEDRPPAAWLNWFMNLTAESLHELQTKAAEKTYVDDQISEAIKDIDVDIPDASLTQKGITMLSNATNGIREDVAATEKAVGLAFQAGNERKAEVVALLVAKGVSATISESWASLITKLTAMVRATGNATLADVLAGKTFSTAAGNAMVGTMPDYSTYPLNGGYAGAKSFKVDGSGNLVIEPNTGYYKSGLNAAGFGAILVNDPDFIASNFRSDKNIFGLQGSIPITSPDISTHYTTAGVSVGAYSGDGQNSLYLQIPNNHYFEGVEWVRIIAPNLLPQNIKNGEVVLGVTGTLTGIVSGSSPLVEYLGGNFTSSPTPNRIREVSFNTDGIYRIRYQVSCSGGVAHSQIYVNSVARGAVRDISNATLYLGEDITIKAGDVLQVMLWLEKGSSTTLSDFSVCSNVKVSLIR